VCGVDLDKERISYGREEHGLDLYYGTLAEVPFDREPDLVIYSQTLEHLLDPVEELKAVSSILGEGLVFVRVPGIKCLAQTHFMDFLCLLQNAHTYHFTLTTLKNVMRIGGFSMVRGDERIWSIFRRSTETDPREYESDYEEVGAFAASCAVQGRIANDWKRVAECITEVGEMDLNRRYGRCAGSSRASE